MIDLGARQIAHGAVIALRSRDGFGDSPTGRAAAVGGAPLLSFAVALTGFSLTAIVLAVVRWWPRRDAHASAPPAVVLPGAPAACEPVARPAAVAEAVAVVGRSGTAKRSLYRSGGHGSGCAGRSIYRLF